MVEPPRIVLGVTVDMSLRLLRGFPQYLAENGWDVHVVSAPGPALDELAGTPGVTTHAITMTRQPSPVRDVMSLVAWVRLLTRRRPDLISVGTPKAGLLGGLAGWLVRVPHRVYLLRGLRLETSTGIRRKILASAERLAISSSHHVLSVSTSLRAKAIALGLADPDKISVLGLGSSNGVEADDFSRKNFSDDEVARLRHHLGLVEGVPVIGFVGRLTEDKGLRVLIGARDALVQERLDHQLLVVGGIEAGDRYPDGFNSNAGGRPAVVTGQVTKPEIYFQLMDILCLPTLREGFPNVVLEAAAAGVPTVTTTATGAVDSVVHGETGLIAEVGSSEDLSRQLAILLRDAGRRRAMGKQAERFVRKNYDRSLVWARTAAFYSHAISADASRSKAT